MSNMDAQHARRAAAQINDLIVDLWITTERNGPRYDEFDLSSQQHAVLSHIVSQPEITPNELALALGVTRGAISQHLSALEQAGYISRERSERDRRVHVLRLEPLGERYRDALQQFEKYTVDRYLERLSSSDITEIVAALQKLQAAFAD